MKHKLLMAAILVLLPAGACFGAHATPTPAPTPVPAKTATGPQVKSKAEADAYQAMMQATTADARIKAGDDFLNTYADSELKPFALLVMTDTFRQKNDFADEMVYGQRAIEADSHNFMVPVWLATGVAENTHEFDLDKEKKLKQAEDYAHQALDVMKTAPKMSPNLTDAQWNGMKADFAAQAHDALALVAMLRKNYPAAIGEFQTAVSLSPAPDAARGIHLAEAYRMAGKPDQALAQIDKVLAIPGLSPAAKQAAEKERARDTAAQPKPAAAPESASPVPATAPMAK